MVVALLVVGTALSTGAPASVRSADDGKSLDGESIEVAAVWSGTEQERFRAVIDRFESETGASVTYTSTGDDIAAVLTPRIAGGDAPDVAMLPQPGLLNDFATQGVLQPIEDAAGATVDENYASIWRTLGSVDDTLYGVWFKAANKSLWWYNAQVFSDAGVKPPKSFDGLMETAETVNDFGVTPISVGGADGWTLTDQFENIYLTTAGPEKYDQLARHEIPWTDASVKTALTTMGELLQPGLIAGGPDAALQTEFPASVSQVFADPPDAAMVMEGDFVAGVIDSDTTATVGDEAKVFPYPAADSDVAPVVVAGDMAVLMNDSEAGRAFVEYLATPEAATIWAKLGGFISPNRNVPLKSYNDKITRTIAKQVIDAGDDLRFDMSDLQPAAFGATVGAGLWKEFQDFLQNPTDVDGTAAAMESAATAAYAQGS